MSETVKLDVALRENINRPQRPDRPYVAHSWFSRTNAEFSFN